MWNLRFWPFVPGLLSALLNPSGVWAQSPDVGILYGQRDTNSITYECSHSGEFLECDFVQVSVRRDVEPDDIPQKLSEARSRFDALTNKDITQLCRELNEMASFVRAYRKGEIPRAPDIQKAAEFADKARTFSKMTELEKLDAFKLADVISKFCENPSTDRYVAMTRQSLERETRTCSISTNPYKQTFKRVHGSQTWVVSQDGAQGTCGIINLSRFEPVTLKDTNFQNLKLWRYFAKRVVTNKSGSFARGMSCSDLDESEYEFDWRSKTIQKGCDYVTFSVF